ncbi:MAG: hypothetical protein JWM88_1281 [Verrucomicrobia bacterium]|nr:hypothetical protein [Verrucomicrobiota bacterium]
MFSDLFHRKPRRSVLIEINPFQILAAGVSRGDHGMTVIDCAAEFHRDDDAGLRAWLEANFRHQRSWIPAICGLVPVEGFLQRETLQVRRLAEPAYLPNLVREKYKIADSEDWRFRILSPLEGTPLLADAGAQPALICGVSHRDVRQVEQRLFDHGLRPSRLEPSVLPLLGAVFDHMARGEDKGAAVVVRIEEEQTIAYVLGKEGVHTPAPVRLGFQSILQSARKELGLTDGDDILALLRQPDHPVRYLAPKIVRAIGRDLKPLIDSYEMTTGQPAAGIYCAFLPADLAWLAEPLADAAERPTLAIDCAKWIPTVRLQAGSGLPPFGPHWLSALSLIAEFPGTAPQKTTRQDEPYRGPWHVDCQLSADLPGRQLVGRRFIAGAIAAALAAFAITITVWQVFAANSLRADTAYWETEMAKNRKLFDELTRTASELQQRSTRLEFAYGLMASPYQVSDFVMNLGRTLPRNMRIDRIEQSQGKIALSGALREPSEAASGTLNRYLEELRNSPVIGPLFSSIGLTALQREPDSDALAFEITFKLKAAQP